MFDISETNDTLSSAKRGRTVFLHYTQINGLFDHLRFDEHAGFGVTVESSRDSVEEYWRILVSLRHTD